MVLKKHPIDTCHICHQGWVVIVKEVSSEKLLVYCNECESEWIHPENYFNNEESSLFNNGRIAEPGEEEVISAKWDKYVSNELKSRIK
ncbi:hypothetical protein [Paenibacillus massiliensis]|uniref:hypothetical protein n=1 Tax=Paenibacillus massiliensis TaxID=225917 RepID=UPI0005685EEE|nr:hypothetical protein [Paenibacillus massiliensis]